MELRLVLAENVRRIRLERGLSQEELADAANLHRTYISGIERGIRNIGIDNVGTLAVALEVLPEELVRLPPPKSGRRGRA